jgi:ElaB/YqjD/DUF883 family membrane-anchored ribosome-binding protein
MNERIDRMRDTSLAGGRRLVDEAQQVASRAGAFMQSRMGDVSERAQDFAQDASARVERLTGRPIESWATDARKIVRRHPLGAMAVTIGLGYILGKLLTPRD